MEFTSRIATAGAAGALVLGGVAAVATPAQAATNQNGLVNVALTNTSIQVPIGIAANVCGTTVAALSALTGTGSTTCNATSTVTATEPGRQPGNTNQNGLINISLSGTSVQVPVGIALNVCNTTVALLSVNTVTGAASCTAVSSVAAA